jgi:hypothetical protein
MMVLMGCDDNTGVPGMWKSGEKIEGVSEVKETKVEEGLLRICHSLRTTFAILIGLICI